MVALIFIFIFLYRVAELKLSFAAGKLLEIFFCEESEYLISQPSNDMNDY